MSWMDVRELPLNWFRFNKEKVNDKVVNKEEVDEAGGATRTVSLMWFDGFLFIRFCFVICFSLLKPWLCPQVDSCN